MVQDYSQLPLRDRLKHAEMLARELVEHLEQGFIPKVERVRKVTRQANTDSTTDHTIRDQVDLVLNSERFTREVYSKLNACLQSISTDVEKMVTP